MVDEIIKPKESELARQARLLEEQNTKMEEENKDRGRFIQAREKNIELKKDRALLDKQSATGYRKLLKNKNIMFGIGIFAFILIFIAMKGC